MRGLVVGGFPGRLVGGLVGAELNWHMGFVALAILGFAVAGALFAWLPPERARVHHHGDTGHGSSLQQHLRNPQLVTTYAIGFCVLFTQVAMFTYVTFYLAAPPFRLSTVALGWLFVVYLIGAVVTPFGGRCI